MKTGTEKNMRSDLEGKHPWLVYILLCRDGSFYTGMTNDMDRRFKEHREGRASRYTRSRKPVKVVYRERCEDRSHALKREFAVKALSRIEKENLVKTRRRMNKTGSIEVRQK